MIKDFELGSLDYLDALFEASNDVILLLDENHNIKKSNLALKKIFPEVSNVGGIESRFSALIGSESYKRIFKPALEACLEKNKKAGLSKWSNYQNRRYFFNWSFLPIPSENGYRPNILAIAKDVTELQNLKDSLLQKDLELKSLIQSETDCVFFLDNSMNVFDTNNQGLVFAKKNSNNLFQTGDNISSFISNKYIVPLKLMIDEVRRTRETVVREKHSPKSDKYFEFTFKPINELSGNLIGTVIVARDITTEKRAEKEMHLSRNKLKALFDSSIQSIFLLGKNFEVLEFNKRASDSISKIWNKSLAIGDNIGEYFIDAMHERFTTSFNSALQGNKSVIEQKIDYPNGLKVWSEITFVPVFNMDGEIFGVSFSTLDITERKLVEARLRKNEANLSSLIENDNTLIWAVDRNCKLILYNSHFKRFFEKTFKTSLDQNAEILNYLNTEAQNYFRRQFRKVFKGHSVREDFEIQLPSGTFVAEIIINPIISEAEIIGASVISMDIADRKFREIELEQLNSSYKQEIEIRKKIEEDLKFKNTELDTFIYKASHDLRGPIASLMGLYNAATIEIKDPKSLEYLEYINKTAQRMDQVLKALIGLSEIKDRALNFESASLKRLVDEVISILEVKNCLKDIEFQIKVPEVEIVTDSGLLMVIIKNLLENAIRYSRVSTKSVIKLNAKILTDQSLQITIADNGLGVPSHIQDKVFNMFFKGNNLSPGSGLGLYMVKSAAYKLGGKVSLKSIVNKGTTLLVRLPAIAPELQEQTL